MENIDSHIELSPGKSGEKQEEVSVDDMLKASQALIDDVMRSCDLAPIDVVALEVPSIIDHSMNANIPVVDHNEIWDQIEALYAAQEQSLLGS